MNNQILLRFIIIIIIITATSNSCEAQKIRKNSYRNPERALFGKSLSSKSTKIKEPRSVSKAKKKQAKNEKRLKKEYADFVDRNRQRSVEIQTPEVRERMLQNRKEAEERSVERRKNIKANSRKTARKYRKQ
jgi:hypothetical protein